MSETWAALGAEAIPLAGGYSGETFLVGAAGEQAVLRIYGRDPGRVVVDAALLDLMRGLVPVPRVLEMQTPEQDAGPAYLLTELLPGRRLDEVLPTADADLRARIGHSLGLTLARLAGVPFRATGGFADAALVPDTSWLPVDSLAGWAHLRLRDGALARWSAVDRGGLLKLADAADTLLDEPQPRHCLVHSDFNTKNLLVDLGTGEVTGLLDWEFAHAGSPYSDLGNLLRFERDEVLVQAVLREYADRAPATPPDLVRRARAQDLWALIQLAGRAEEHDNARQAHDLLLAMVRARDLTAVPATPPPA